MVEVGATARRRLDDAARVELEGLLVGLDGNVNVAFIPASSGPLVIIPGVSFAPVTKYVF